MKATILVLFYLILVTWQTKLFASSTPVPVCKYSAADYQSVIKKFEGIEFHQSNPKPEANLAMAKETLPEFEEIFRILRYKTNGETYIADLKSLTTIENKSERKVSEHGYKNTRKIHDYLRGSVVFESMHELITAFQYLASFKSIEVGEVSDYFSKPKDSGYRALNFSIRFKHNNYVAEIQFHLKNLFEEKLKNAEPVYREIREIELDIKSLKAQLESLYADKQTLLDGFSSWKNNLITRAVVGSEKRTDLKMKRNDFQTNLDKLELEIADLEKHIADRTKELKIHEQLHNAIYERALIPYMDELREIFGDDYI